MFKLLTGILIVIGVCGCAVAQSPSRDGWMRVQSDDGAISVEVPSGTVLFANPGGFIETNADASARYHLNDMKMLSAYFEGTLIVFESYDAPKGALDAIYSSETRGRTEKTNIKKPDYSIKQAIFKNDRTTTIRQFFAFRNRIYLLTTASRGSVSTHMNRFLESVTVNTDKDPRPRTEITMFSKLPRKEPIVELNLEEKTDTSKALTQPTIQAKDDPTVKRYEVLYNPRAAYVESARSKSVTGSIIVKITLDANGYVSRIVVRKSLPEGLLRQVLIAAVRIKFLPKEKKGIPVPVIITREYSFAIF